MWQYNEQYNYYYYFFGVHELTVQPLYETYAIGLYLGKDRLRNIKEYIYADNIEEAKRKAMEMALNFAKTNANFWNSLVSNITTAIDK